MEDDQRSLAGSAMTAHWVGRTTGEAVGTAGQDWLWSALEHAELLDRPPCSYPIELAMETNGSATTETVSATLRVTT
jgi:hypothetical protein